MHKGPTTGEYLVVTNHRNQKMPLPILGNKYGHWTVLKAIAGMSKSSYCRCECGTEKFVPNDVLLKKHDPMCADCSKRNNNKHYNELIPNKQLLTKWRNRWRDIKVRTTYIKDHEYEYYGGRGIKMYEPWINDCKAFLKYAMTLDNWDDLDLQLDRIDNDGDYEPGNLRMITQKQNIRNSSRVLKIEYNKEEIPLIEFYEKHKSYFHSYSSLVRLYKKGLTSNEILKYNSDNFLRK